MATTPKTVKTFPLNSSAKDFNIPFEYLARKFVVVTLIGATRRELILNTDYRFTTATTITTTKAWGPSDNFTLIEIRRLTSASERLVDFADGSILRAYDLNISSVQSLHIAEEARDLTADTIGVNNDGNLDARARRVVNLADGVEDGDAVNLRQQKQWAQSALSQAMASAASAQASAQSAAQALASANSASNSATSSSGYRDQSQSYSITSGQYRDAALTYRDAAAASNTSAQAWASKAEDQIVSGSLYSSLHYASKSAKSATASATSASSAADQVPLAAAQVTLAAAQVTLATNQVTAATTQADRSKTEADRSQGFAAGLSLPSAAGNAGLQLSQNITATGLEYRAVPQRNLLINSAFQVWQRAVQFTNLNGYGCDRWRVIPVGAGTFYTAAQNVGSQFAHRISVTAKGSLSKITMEQRVEDVECVQDAAYVTVAFKLRSTVASGQVSVQLNQNFGTGGSADVLTAAAAQNITAANVWTRYEFRVKLPTTVGKTIGTQNSFLGVQISFPSFGVQAIDIMDVKAEEGFRGTPYERPQIGDEFLRCARYFWRTSPMDWNWASHVAGAIATRYTNLPVIMRPGAVLTTNANTPSGSGGADLNRLTINLNGYRNELRWICYSTFAAESVYIGFNSSNYIQVDAEL